jgi:hypothetical protein
VGYCVFGVSTIETDQRFSGREDFWIIVAARSEDETEIRAGKAAGGRRDQGHSARCPSPDDLRHIAGFQKGGSGSSLIEIMRHAVGAASDGLRLSGA